MKNSFDIHASAAAEKVESNDLFLGSEANSRKIYNEIREASPALWTRTDSIVVDAPGNDVISAISIVDLRDDKTGEATIETGGVGAKSVTIDLKSPSILRGYKFAVSVYATDPYRRYTKGGNAGYAKGEYQGYYQQDYPVKSQY
ncbi:hypothetical protein EVAR_25945_1 [Eumeta japonica]|uniref:Uncharacterized protein n=1 Tax=Eumeta variegata TaxID=151549 RepID=A0A4C1V2M4_EUMVA|nr:hypothetical protein EVAR_25945_1 [Eumeta japonica]